MSRTADDEEALMREWAAARSGPHPVMPDEEDVEPENIYKGEDREPTMEEVLASIRRVLEEEDEGFDLTGHEVDADTGDTDREEDLMREWAAMAGDGDDENYSSDAMAAEWEAMLGAGSPSVYDGFGVASDVEEVRDATRVLNQDEIDSLLGFDYDHGRGDASGISAIFNSASVNYEHLPLLQRILDVFVKIHSKSLRRHFNDNVEVSIDNILSLRFGDYLNSIPLPVMMRPFYSPELDGDMLFVYDSSLVYSSVDVLLGGRRGTAAMRIEGRPYTGIERELVGDTINVAIDDLAEAFKPVISLSFNPKDVETNPRFVPIAKPMEAVIVAKIRIDLEDRGGRVELCIPYSTLERYMSVLRQNHIGDRWGNDTWWKEQIGKIVPDLPIEITVGSPTYKLDIDTIKSLVAGDTLVTNISATNLSVYASNVEIGTGSLGQTRGKVAVQLAKVLGDTEEMEKEDDNAKD